jgi:thiamine biosynthesis protein ThiS
MNADSSIDVVVNGESRRFPAGVTVDALLGLLALHPRLVVVERNGEILRRDVYADTPIDSGDTLELVHFVGGG